MLGTRLQSRVRCVCEGEIDMPDKVSEFVGRRGWIGLAWGLRTAAGARHVAQNSVFFQLRWRKHVSTVKTRCIVGNLTAGYSNFEPQSKQEFEWILFFRTCFNWNYWNSLALVQDSNLLKRSILVSFNNLDYLFYSNWTAVSSDNEKLLTV